MAHDPRTDGISSPRETRGDGVSRRSFLQWFGIGTASALELAVPLRLLAAADPDENPLAGSPARGWEQIYRDQYHYDSRFSWVCSPNDTHSCRCMAYVRNGVITRLGSEYVRTEHILLGLCREPEGIAARTLENLGVDVDNLATEIEQQVQPGSTNISGDDIAFTPRAKKVLELAMTEARELNHSYVGTEHLLLGLLREEKGIAARVVSMPSWRLFEEQPEAYRRQVLPPDIKTRVAIEAGVTQGWHRYVGNRGGVIGLNRFGASAPYKILYEKFGITADRVVEKAMDLLGR